MKAELRLYRAIRVRLLPKGHEARPCTAQNNKPAAPQKGRNGLIILAIASNLNKRRNTFGDGEGCNQRHNRV